MLKTTIYRDLLFVLFLMVPSISFAQEIFSDSIWENEVTPCEHLIHDDSEFYKKSIAKGVHLVGYKLSECKEGCDPYQFLNAISAIDTLGDSLIFYFELSLNCCLGSRLAVDVLDSLTWNFVLTPQDFDECSACFCNCCFSSIVSVVHKTGIMPTRFQYNGDSIALSQNRVERVYSEMKYGSNGNRKSYLSYRALSKMILSRITYDQQGNFMYLEYFDEKGVVIRKHYQTRHD